MIDPVRLLIAKGRNIVYYHSIDDRPRSTYIHILRTYREELAAEGIGVSFLERIYSIIPPKVKTQECTAVIEQMKEIYEQEQQREATQEV